MDRVQKSLDALNAVPWRVNQKVFDVMHKIWEHDLQLAKVPPRENIPLKKMFKTNAELRSMSTGEIKLHLLQIQLRL